MTVLTFGSDFFAVAMLCFGVALLLGVREIVFFRLFWGAVVFFSLYYVGVVSLVLGVMWAA